MIVIGIISMSLFDSVKKTLVVWDQAYKACFIAGLSSNCSSQPKLKWHEKDGTGGQKYRRVI